MYSVKWFWRQLTDFCEDLQYDIIHNYQDLREAWAYYRRFRRQDPKTAHFYLKQVFEIICAFLILPLACLLLLMTLIFAWIFSPISRLR